MTYVLTEGGDSNRLNAEHGTRRVNSHSGEMCARGLGIHSDTADDSITQTSLPSCNMYLW